jgi:hypothetical protein
VSPRFLAALCAALIGCHKSAPSTDAGPKASASAQSRPPVPGDIVLPQVINLPYVVAGQGPSSVAVIATQIGQAPLDGIAWELEGSGRIRLSSKPPASIAAGGSAEFRLQYAGAPAEEIDSAVLIASVGERKFKTKVWAVAGDPSIGPSTWEPVAGAGGVACGEGNTLSLSSSAFPHENTPWKNDSTRVFIPEGYRDLQAQDVVVHFHGFNASLKETLRDHLYEQQLCASGANALLVVPQGPEHAASGDFGKLMHPGGLVALLQQVLIAAYRDGRIEHPLLGEVILTSHSGGYKAVAANLTAAGMAVHEAVLFDSLYGLGEDYGQFVVSGGRLVSCYTPGGGTVDDNQQLAKALIKGGIGVQTAPWLKHLRDAPAVISLADTTHDGSTRLEAGYAEALRFGLRHHRRGPRVELRQATVQAGQATVRWLSPAHDDIDGFVVETSESGGAWLERAAANDDAQQVSFPFQGRASVRVLPLLKGIDKADTLPSDAYGLCAGSDVLVVDGFDRVLGGSFGGLQHDFAARVAEAVGGAMTVSHRALVEDGFDLSICRVMVWLLGDESTEDVTFSPDEQALVTEFVHAGGRIVVSGSEVAKDLTSTGRSATFLWETLGARFDRDDAESNQASGHGALASVPAFVFGRPGAPYEEDSPDALDPVGGGQVLLVYDNGRTAAVGIPGRSAMVGFPLEVVDAAALPVLVKALVSFVR